MGHHHHKGPRHPNPGKTEILPAALRRDLSQAMIAGLQWYGLEPAARAEHPRPTAATERSLVARRLLVIRHDVATDSRELTVAGRQELKKLLGEGP